MKKVVQTSHLALRFYKHNGWTREILEKYLIRGQVSDISDTEEECSDPPDMAYFCLRVGAALDIERLYKEEISSVVRMYSVVQMYADNPNLTDLEFLQTFTG